MPVHGGRAVGNAFSSADEGAGEPDLGGIGGLPPGSGVLALSRDRFATFLKILRESAAEPNGFATPIDADEDSESYTFVFEMTAAEKRDAIVEVRSRSIVIWGPPGIGPTRKRRTCALDDVIIPESVKVSNLTEGLWLKVKKKGPGRLAKGQPPIDDDRSIAT